MNNNPPAKDVIYIDLDDEITAIIDKVRNSKSKIVALVLPKRATTLQSAVNMKLLKRSADEEKKHLVLITSEAGLLPLAAATGMYVAKNLQSKPEIPHIDQLEAADLAEDTEESVMLDEEPLNKKAAVGDLARSMKSKVISPSSPQGAGAAAGLGGATSAPEAVAKAAKSKKDKGLKIPNFNRFRKWLIFGGIGLVVLIFGLYLILSALPKAKIAIKTDSEAINANVEMLLNENADRVDVADGTIPSETQQVQKTFTQQATATGQENNGQKAAGTVTMSAGSCTGDTPADIPAGTGIAKGDLTFITQTSAKFEADTTSQPGKCIFRTKKEIAVVAQSPGAKYNIGPSTFSVVGRAGVTATSSQSMSGGTDDIKKVLQQSDLDSAQQKITSQDTTAIKQELKTALSSKGLYAIEETFVAGNPEVSSTAKAGDKVDSATVTAKITYTMSGAKESDIEKLVKNAVKDDIDEQKQTILDYGLDEASFSEASTTSGGISTTMKTTVVAGLDIDTDTLAKAVAGKKSSEARKIIKDYPGVVDVTINYSPFWVKSIPSNPDKITITIEKPKSSTDAAN